MHVNGPSHIHGPHGVQPPKYLQRPQRAEPTAAQPAGDKLDISPAAEAAIQATEGGEVRSDLVARIRNEIAAGTYETPEKLEAALDRFLDTEV